jgi:hypothetical protein
MLSQWKLFDNLRRSLVPAALVVLLLAGWTVLPHPWLWTLAAIAVFVLPSTCAFLLDLARPPDEVLPWQHFTGTAIVASRSAAQALLSLAFLPYEALVNLDAITRTDVADARQPSEVAGMEAVGGPGFRSSPRRAMPAVAAGSIASVRSMWMAPVIAAATAILLAATLPSALPVAAPILLLWFASPGIAWWVSRPLVRREAAEHRAGSVPAHARATDLGVLRGRSSVRTTVAAARQLSGASGRIVAHRTSPTNMGYRCSRI